MLHLISHTVSLFFFFAAAAAAAAAKSSRLELIGPLLDAWMKLHNAFFVCLLELGVTKTTTVVD